MKDFLSVVVMNLAGFDIVIFILAICNCVIYNYTKKSADDLYNKMHLTVFVPDQHNSRAYTDRELGSLRESDVSDMRNKMGKRYSLFVNLSGIFPLLGILGTVISLISLTSDLSNAQGNFYGALTSTFWGLVFAIIFKILDGVISAKIEDNEKTVQLYLERNSSSRAEKAEIHE